MIRTDVDGSFVQVFAGGFRNAYDIAFNRQGELFTFDSDMEWDDGLPWYRPTRVNHVVAGAEFGWRSGWSKWPDYYIDSLPAVIDIGRGSPTGVVFYEHGALPEKYHGSLLICDWSMGRLIAAKMEPKGATFTGTSEVIASGNPLNIADIDVGRDGSIVFCTGGRGTEGGVYRIFSAEAQAKVDDEKTDQSFARALSIPQLQSGWAREEVRGIKAKLGHELAQAAQAQRLDVVDA